MLIARAAKAVSQQGSRAAAKKALGSAGELLALFMQFAAAAAASLRLLFVVVAPNIKALSIFTLICAGRIAVSSRSLATDQSKTKNNAPPAKPTGVPSKSETPTASVASAAAAAPKGELSIERR